MKKFLLINLLVLSSFGLSFGQLYREDFDEALDGTTGLYPYSYRFDPQTTSTMVAVSKPTASEYNLHLDGTGGNNVYDQGYGFGLYDKTSGLPVSVDMTGQESLTFSAKSSVAFVLTVVLHDGSNNGTDLNNIVFNLPGDNTYHTYTHTFTTADFQSYISQTPNPQPYPVVDRTDITDVQISFNKGDGADGPVMNTDLTFDYFYLGNLATGINKNFVTNANINLFPNPSTGKVIVENNSSYAVTAVSVLNTSGVEVFNQAGDLSSVELSNLNKGIYFMKVQTTGGTMMKKVVLQ